MGRRVPRSGAGEKDDPVFCDGGYTRESRDVDCDGLPNAEDPTPIGDDTPDIAAPQPLTVGAPGAPPDH